MRIVLLVLLSVLLMHTDCFAAEELTAASYKEFAKRTAGKMVYPSEFFKIFALDTRLEKLLGKKRYTVVKKELHVEHPVEEKNGVLNFGMCRPHNCPLDAVDFFIDLATGKIAACSQGLNADWPVWYEEGAQPKTIQGLSCGDMELYDKMANSEKYRRQDEENKRLVVGTWEGSLDMEQKDKAKPFITTIKLRIALNPSKLGSFVFTQTMEMRLKNKNQTFKCSNANTIVVTSEGNVDFSWGEIGFNGKVKSGAECAKQTPNDTAAVHDTAKVQNGDLFPYHSGMTGLLNDFRLKKQR